MSQREQLFLSFDDDEVEVQMPPQQNELYFPDEIVDLIACDNALFFCSHSGGKDSQAMYALLKKSIPPEQLVVIHASLGDVEWPGVIEHIESNTDHDVHVVEANKTFLEMVENRGKWPSAAYRQCTSDLKRGPIFKFIRNYMKKRGATIAVNCMGLRAQESNARSKKQPLRYNTQESVDGRVTRHVYDWLPVFYFSTNHIFQTINESEQDPFWAYRENERLSCVFCIMGCVSDLRHGAGQNPELYKRYVDLEKKIGHTVFMKGKEPISLEDHVGIKVNAELKI